MPLADVEGLHPSLYRTLEYPGYDGGRTMDDIPAAYIKSVFLFYVLFKTLQVKLLNGTEYFPSYKCNYQACSNLVYVSLLLLM